MAGEGLKNGILATFDSSFAVDTRGAGQGQLNVKVRGKKGQLKGMVKNTVLNYINFCYNFNDKD